MMKRILLLTLSLAALVGCQQMLPTSDTTEEQGSTANRPQGYVALPGQAATSDTPSDTTQAFEYAAASLGSGTPATASAPQAQQPQKPAPIPEPRPAQQPTTVSNRAAASAPYAVQVTNGTTGRLYVEAYDEGHNIFPFGFLHPGQRVGTQPQDPQAIQGRITLIIRDPDRAGAPELRRYFVAPPARYEGKTIGITILPGGRYRATLDGVIYYTSPEPPPAGL